MKKIFLNSVSRLRELLCSFEYKLRSRIAPKHFSREGGKLGFSNTVMNLMNFNNKSQQIELGKYFDLIGEETHVSQQAFSKARQKINPIAFKEMYEVTLKDVPNNPELATICDYTPVGIDGSTIALDNLPGLIEFFGCSGPKASSCTGRISIACDTLNGIILDAAICEYAKGERRLAAEHVNRVIELGVSKPLFTFDRGYAGKKLLAQIDDAGHKYILRVRSRWLANMVSSVKSGELGEFTYKKKTYKTRVIKLTTQKDTDMILFSNVAEFTEEDFARIYKLRWPVETKYDVIKNKLMLENFTGKTVVSVLQDFWATMTLSNLSAFTKLEADSQIEQADKEKDNKHKYQANTNILIGNLKDKLILMLLCDDPVRQSKMFDDIMAKIVKSKVPITRNKSNPRKHTRQKKKFNQCTKSAL